jgi:hypothetical protein
MTTAFLVQYPLAAGLYPEAYHPAARLFESFQHLPVNLVHPAVADPADIEFSGDYLVCH